MTTHCTSKEYDILELLSLHKGRTLTEQKFLDHLYGGKNEPQLKIIDVFICKLRKKLSRAAGGEQYIETVWGRGYCTARPRGGHAGIAARSARRPLLRHQQPGRRARQLQRNAGESGKRSTNAAVVRASNARQIANG